MDTERKTETKKQLPEIKPLLLVLLSFFVSACSAVLFMTILSSRVFMVLKVLSTAVMCLTPAFITKTFIVMNKMPSRRTLGRLILLGAVLSAMVSLSFYVSHDYSLSVYRFMKQSYADEYYFGGYDEYRQDYADAADFEKQMKAAPASIVLESMSSEKISSLSAQELKTINSSSLWDYCGFTDILGSDAEEIEASMLASKGMSAYDFTFSYRGLHAKTFWYMMAHPSLMLSETGMMIKNPGRYSVSFTTLIFFFLVQLFSDWMIAAHFDVTAGKGIVYVNDELVIMKLIRRLSEKKAEGKKT